MARQKKSTEAQGVAVIYARYSSHSQREVSIEQQIDECREYAQCAGIVDGSTVILRKQDWADSGEIVACGEKLR